ncbi:unnamed protein product [Caenorhabditis angaria]|uniref:Uncharacterized protein n=1 Tax=Caenorhabditis angaria TaxID=860376 RepID=A0A9P1IAH2_9PELO|nr:unnamed protein product [Caenorhabditis angaria]
MYRTDQPSSSADFFNEQNTVEDPAFYDWFLSPKYGNLTPSNETDVLCANCIGHRNIIACVRSSAIALLGICTAVICLARISKLHSTSQSHLKLLLYYILTVHCFAGSFEWLIGWTTQTSLFISYTKAIILLVVCYFYLDIASSMMHWSSTAGKRLCFVALFLLFTYFTAFLVMGFVLSSIEPRLDCRAPYWIWFSVGQCFIVQLMVASFCMILGRMNRISAPVQMRANQRRDVFVLMWTFETATLTDLAYHIALFMLADGDNANSCSALFDHDQIRYSILKGPYDLINFIMPVWAVLYVFRTKIKTRSDSETETGSTASTRSSSHSRNVRIADVVTVRNWRRRYRPLTQPSINERPVLHSQWRQQRANATPINNPVGQRLRSVSSAPMIRRVSISHSSIVGSPLYSIPEEFQNYAPIHNSSLEHLSTEPLLND